VLRLITFGQPLDPDDNDSIRDAIRPRIQLETRVTYASLTLCYDPLRNCEACLGVTNENDSI
jgi:hypothetical protein